MGADGKTLNPLGSTTAEIQIVKLKVTHKFIVVKQDVALEERKAIRVQLRYSYVSATQQSSRVVWLSSGVGRRTRLVGHAKCAPKI